MAQASRICSKLKPSSSNQRPMIRFSSSVQFSPSVTYARARDWDRTDMEDAGVGPSASGWQASARIPPISRKLPIPETAQVVAPRKKSFRFFHQTAAFTAIARIRNGRPALLLRDCSIRLITSAHAAGFHLLPRILSLSVHSRYRQNTV